MSENKEARERLKELNEIQTRLGKKINKKVLGMIEHAEEEYKELMNKRRIIENDRVKIEKTIKGLDEKKRIALEETWEKVNGDFGSIFGSLLTGAEAKLDPVRGNVESELVGLEVKVGFGGCWKESL